VSDLVIFDTSVLIDNLRTGRHQQRIESVSGLIRTSAVVLAELWRGATKPAEREFLRALQRNHPILTPTAGDWLESGQILAKINADRRCGPEKLRDLHFDILIALTARSHSARLIASNPADFELIAAHKKFQLEVWQQLMRGTSDPAPSKADGTGRGDLPPHEPEHTEARVPLPSMGRGLACHIIPSNDVP